MYLTEEERADLDRWYKDGDAAGGGAVQEPSEYREIKRHHDKYGLPGAYIVPMAGMKGRIVSRQNGTLRKEP